VIGKTHPRHRAHVTPPERQTDPSKKLHCDGNPFTMRGTQFVIIEILEGLGVKT
jgi:hypothetical protein